METMAEVLEPVLTIDYTGGSLRLAVAGRMHANGIGEFRRLIDEARRRRKPVFLDLAEVTLVDRTSAQYLASVVGSYVRVENAPQYLRNWIGLK
jgi:hypothetical protein